MSYPVKEIWINILSVIVGIISAIIIFMTLNILILLFSGLIPFGDDPSANRLVYIIILMSIFISSAIGGYITGMFSERNYWLYSPITGVALTVTYFLSDDFKINNNFFYSLALIIIIPSTLIGCYLSNKKKSKI